MRLLPSLLLAALGGVVGAAPAAPVVIGQPAGKSEKRKERKPDEPGKKEPGEDKPARPRGPVVARIVFKEAESARDRDSGAGGGTAVATPEDAPSVRVRRLPAPRPRPTPYRSNDADLRAGLLGTPPPGA